MPDLKDPCTGCKEPRKEQLGQNYRCWRQDYAFSKEMACGPYAAYQAVLKYREKLKGEGVHYGYGKLVQMVGVNRFDQHRGPGWLVWIPE